tara:strand:- start:2820 stop:4187 length:1368 start_codon:yes stop_codon:yes gene_type:complete
MHFRLLSGLVLLLVFVTAVACQDSQDEPNLTAASATSPQSSFEVWAVDQSGTSDEPSADSGGLIYIWDGVAISENASEATPEIIDLAVAASKAGCEAPKKPHMVLANHTNPKASHIVLANVGSGDTFFINIESRTIVGCVNTVGGFNGAGGTANTHASTASADNSMVIVANIGAKDESGFLHKIQTDYTNDDYSFVETLALNQFSNDLGTSVARPICHEFTADSKFAYVTMAGGGLLVVDVGSADGTTPMTVVKVYDKDTVPGIGCGVARLPNGKIMTNGESGAKGGDDFLYTFDASKAADGVFPDPVQIELPGEDTHGAVTCTDQNGNLFAITSMRVSNDVNFIDLQTNKVVATQSMAETFSPDPKPDVADIVGNKMFIALRGHKPLTAIGSLESADRTPGVAVLTISESCKSFSWEAKDLASMKDSDRTIAFGLTGGSRITAADPHGLEVVIK